ncbi:MAG: hypothetical protein HY348_14365 [Nitrospira defluvii]|nr:hypothetical protein [Nitrospira defluvii]
MNPTLSRSALFYPFHLCAPRTLEALLARYQSIHFRDYMALRLTPLMGTMAYQDRMGDDHPTLVEAGRLVQGYPVSGPLNPAATAAVDRDLGDPCWRALFHEAMRSDRRFQRGLFDLTHAMRIGQALVPGPAALLRLLEANRADSPCSVALLQGLARPSLTLEEAYAFEYGLALLKTAAAQVYTIRLAQQHDLLPVTDSHSHFALLSHALAREGLDLGNDYVGMATGHLAPHHTIGSHG